MDRALALAEEAAAHDEAPVGAVVVEGERVLAAERNRMRELNDPTAHAEIVVIRRAAQALKRLTLDAAHGTHLRLFTTCEPCAMCLGATLWSGVQRVVSGAQARWCRCDRRPGS